MANQERQRNILNNSSAMASVYADNTSMLILKNKNSLCEDLKHIISMPELCDVMFIVGESRQLIYGVKAILSTRSRQFYQLFLKQSESVTSKPKSSSMNMLLKFKRNRSSSRHHKTANDSGFEKLAIRIEDFDPESFRCLVRYAHCGTARVGIKSVIGLMNAAGTFGFEDLRDSCWDFAINSICPENIADLLTASKRYHHFKLTKSLLKQITEYIKRAHETSDTNTGEGRSIPDEPANNNTSRLFQQL